MKLQSIQIRDFKRFSDLSIDELPSTAKLVLVTGPNGSGKTSLFEAFNFWMGHAKSSIHYESGYYERSSHQESHWSAVLRSIELKFHGITDTLPQNRTRKDFYIRSAYRHEAEFTSNGLGNADDILNDSRRPPRLIQQEQRVSENYQRMVANAVKALFSDDPAIQQKKVVELANELIDEVRVAMMDVFGDLVLEGLGNPLTNGTFRFKKGTVSGFHYKNLSGGEKAAFDLLLDFIVKRKAFDDTVYCIDEPELHMHTRLQAKLLEVMFGLIPDNCQLWLSTHSIGMARKAAELYAANPGQVDRHDSEIQQLQIDGTQVLQHRDLESYLWDVEVFEALCIQNGLPEKVEELKAEKAAVLADGVGRGAPPDDIKVASGQLYNKCKQVLGLTQCGNDAEAFARLTLAPLVKPGTKVYQELAAIVVEPVRQKNV